MTPMTLAAIQVGDQVVRWIGDAVFMPLRVTRVTLNTIECGDWVFDRRTGGEIDDVLGWDGVYTGSYLKIPVFGKSPTS